MPMRAARLRGGHEVVAHAIHRRAVERHRRVIAGRVRHRRGRLGLPAERIAGRDLRSALPGRAHRRLPAGVPELHGDRHRRPRAHGSQHAAQRRLAAIGVQAEVERRDAPLARDRRRLENHQPGAAQRELSEVDQVPVAGRAVVGRVLAHRRDDDPVDEAKPTEVEGREELAHERRGERLVRQAGHVARSSFGPAGRPGRCEAD
jgi:hypothetical protein